MAENDGDQAIDSRDKKLGEFDNAFNARREILDAFLKDAELESPRFQAFADYADLIGTGPLEDTVRTSQALILETIRQRKNGIRGYKKEHDLVSKLGGEYRNKVREYVETNVHLKSNVKGATEQYTVIELFAIKEQKIDSIQRSHAPRQQ